MLHLSENDVIDIVRLLGDTASISGGHAEKKRFLMDGLCQLINVDAWVWTLGCKVKPDEQQVYVGFMHGGFTEERFSHLLEALEHKDMAHVASSFATALQVNKGLTTMCREEIDPGDLAHLGEAGALWDKANIGSLILSGYPLDDTSVSCIGLYRQLQDSLLGEREKQIAHLILGEVEWLHLSGWPEDRGAEIPKLFPRQRIVLNLLLDGLGRKEISQRMEITENTVAGYIKGIYKHFRVSSQAQLLSKFIQATPQE